MKALLLTATTAAALVAGVAIAQQAPAPAPQPKAERQISQQQFEARQAQRTERMFARLDANKDGAITKAELDAASKARFEKADANKDGVLSGDELKRGKGMRGHRMHRQPA